VTLTADELRARRAPLADGRRRWLERLARVGMAARAVLIVLIGGLAVALALGAGGKATDSEGAMHTIAGTAWGTAVLVALAVGFGVEIAHAHVSPVDVDRDDLVAGTNVDAVLTVLFRRTGDELVDLGYELTDEIRDATRRVRRVRTALEGDDLELVSVSAAASS
jgi:hypothetical protein